FRNLYRTNTFVVCHSDSSCFSIVKLFNTYYITDEIKKAIHYRKKFMMFFFKLFSIDLKYFCYTTVLFIGSNISSFFLFNLSSMFTVYYNMKQIHNSIYLANLKTIRFFK